MAKMDDSVITITLADATAPLLDLKANIEKTWSDAQSLPTYKLAPYSDKSEAEIEQLLGSAKSKTVIATTTQNLAKKRNEKPKELDDVVRNIYHCHLYFNDIRGGRASTFWLARALCHQHVLISRTSASSVPTVANPSGNLQGILVVPPGRSPSNSKLVRGASCDTNYSE
jgi:hypothetical protein